MNHYDEKLGGDESFPMPLIVRVIIHLTKGDRLKINRKNDTADNDGRWKEHLVGRTIIDG